MTAVSSVSVWRSLRSRCWQREHLWVNKSIFAKVTIYFMALSLSLSLSSSSLFISFFVTSPLSSCSFLLSVYFSSLSYFHWLVQAPSARRRKAQTAALSAFSSHQPDCTATGGYITAVSGQQQVHGRACQPRWAPTSPTGCCWPSAWMSPTHTHIHIPTLR